MNQTISVARDFSPYPAGRFRTDGKFSGQAFREDLLQPRIRDLAEGETLTVAFDGVKGCGSSVIDEAFAGLVRNEVVTKEFLRTRISITTGGDARQADLVERVKQNIHDVP